MFDVNGISNAIAAIGALGTASFALVDTSKILRGGGASNSGFCFIENVVKQFLPSERRLKDKPKSKADVVEDLLDILHGNWINGMNLADQKAIAKSLIKLRLTEETSGKYAQIAGADPDVLKDVAKLMEKGATTVSPQPTGPVFTPQQSNVLGRFDLALTAVLDASYQRADQRYRNSSRVWAMVVSIILAVLGGWAIASDTPSYFTSSDWLKSLLCGLLATPLAPVAKDLTSALAAAVNAAQAISARK